MLLLDGRGSALRALFSSPGCKESNVVVPTSVLSSTKPILTGADYNADNNGDGVRDQKLTVAVEPATIAASGIYTEDPALGAVTATIEFCVRFSLLTGAGATEVNFLETLVTLFVVGLTDGFAIGDVDVAPKIKLKNTANQVRLLDGYQCDTSNDALTGADLTDTRNQGSIIRVCVKPDTEAFAAGIKIRCDCS